MAKRKMPSEEEVASVTEETASKKTMYVKENDANVRIRTAPRIDAEFTGNFLGDGWHEIVEIKPGKGSEKGWGRLASGAGWVALDFVTMVEE